MPFYTMFSANVASYLARIEPTWTYALIVAVLFLLTSPYKAPFPVINQSRFFDIGHTAGKKRFLQGAHRMIRAGLSKSSVFYITSDNGPKIVLAPKYAHEIRSHHALSFGKAATNEFQANIRGFEPFRQGTTGDRIFQDAIRMKLTQNLGNVTRPLAEETGHALEEIWTNNADWHELALKPSILRLVSRLSSRVFLGEMLCRNTDWLRITADYAVHSFLAAEELRLWPMFLRSSVAHFLPPCQLIRKELQEAKEIIIPVLEERRLARQNAIRQGKTPERYVDAIQWMEESAKGRPYDPAVAQLSFSTVAIHTTTDMLCQVLLDLCGRSEVVEALRTEVISVIQEDRWEKSSLYKLKLMDSVLKESQRLKPIAIATMRRLALEDINLSDGTTIPKGATTVVSCDAMWDPSVYPEPETFDAYRFLKLRETPGHETTAQAASPSPHHLGFGFGKHACPGRFFAINEIKIALCHILLKYDFKLAEGYTPTLRRRGLSLNVDPLAKISVRRRKQQMPFLS
ncbi:cytochrome protein [Aspergillus sclerotiicarbonarius CBS 121057]|uniref:Cytochrome protein n=1 Tax=Aspergillus sclerotiicarbonarius (strain CBS 121057 / IBT 28362) TaxID=1448318 RepID=A0A319F863_ASPSB|nr:cytochrome protein [Aspergillus sclerotiicarbonarius CBS 121057]